MEHALADDQRRFIRMYDDVAGKWVNVGDEVAKEARVYMRGRCKELVEENLQNMKKEALRRLAIRTPGINRNKKNAAGKWVPKTSQQLKAELRAVKVRRNCADLRKK